MTLERLSSGLKERCVQVGSLEIPYLETGHGPPLILIHGFGGDSYNFARVARHLRRRFRVLIPDLPGFGKATRAAELTYSIDSQADRIELHAFTGNRIGAYRRQLDGWIYRSATGASAPTPR